MGDATAPPAAAELTTKGGVPAPPAGATIKPEAPFWPLDDDEDDDDDDDDDDAACAAAAMAAAVLIRPPCEPSECCWLLAPPELPGGLQRICGDAEMRPATAPAVPPDSPDWPAAKPNQQIQSNSIKLI